MLDQRIEIGSVKDAGTQVYLITAMACLVVGFSLGMGVGYAISGGNSSTAASTELGTSDSPPSGPSGGPKAAATASWAVDESKSPVDDSATVVLSLAASKAPAGSFGKGSASLIIRCREHRTSLYVALDEYLGSDDTTVIYRINDEPSRTASWSLSTDGKAAFAPAPVAFAKQLSQSSTFFVRISDFRGSTYEAEFKTAGLNTLLPKVATACKWD